MMRAIIALILVIAAMLFVGLSFGDYAIGWNDLRLFLSAMPMRPPRRHW